MRKLDPGVNFSRKLENPFKNIFLIFLKSFKNPFKNVSSEAARLILVAVVVTESEDDGREDGRLAAAVAAVQEVEALRRQVLVLGVVHEVLQANLADLAGLKIRDLASIYRLLFQVHESSF
jgi:hypothetical protein